MDIVEELWEERDEDQVESKERNKHIRLGDTLASSSFADDLTCPICMSLLRDPFATACGHTFCYLCLTTHLNSRSTCPSCATYLIKDNVFPNFMLSKVTPLPVLFSTQAYACCLPSSHIYMGDLHVL